MPERNNSIPEWNRDLGVVNRSFSTNGALNFEFTDNGDVGDIGEVGEVKRGLVKKG